MPDYPRCMDGLEDTFMLSKFSALFCCCRIARISARDAKYALEHGYEAKVKKRKRTVAAIEGLDFLSTEVKSLHSVPVFMHLKTQHCMTTHAFAIVCCFINLHPYAGPRS
jgi:hypothetical protein